MIPDFTQPQEVVVTTLQGLEPLLADEMKALGIADVSPGHRAVSGTADLRGIYRLNYELRTALKVLVPMFRFRAVHPDHLYKAARKLPWSDLFTLDQTFAIEAAVASDIFTHSQFAALRLKDAIADHFRTKFQARPNVNVDSPDFSFHLRIEGPNVQISLNTSGASLHKRGYRLSGARAPLSEVLAAGMLMHAGWSGEGTFLDPMCGSGTLPIEAAMIAGALPAQMFRPQFGFEAMQAFDIDLWEDVQDEALERISGTTARIVASELSRRTLDQARENAERVGRHVPIAFEQKDFFARQAPDTTGLIVMNPPYGQRIEEVDIDAFYGRIGDAFKQQFSGWTAWVLSANGGAMKHLGLRTTQKMALFNGPAPCKYFRYDMYAGSRKQGAGPEGSSPA